MILLRKRQNYAFKVYAIFIVLLSIVTLAGAQSKPNIIFILGDDVGYNLLSVNGSKSYSTPNLDSMAHHGINFTHCEGSPLCSPSRCMLLTGKYNFRNYSNWGFINETEKTFGNVMQDAGYVTGFFGKLQLQYDHNIMLKWGWDKYSVFDLSSDTVAYSRYKNPVLVQDGYRIPDSVTANKYGDDVLTNQILEFIDSNKTKPFFVYYPMSIAHVPFSPTPDDDAFTAWDPKKKESDTVFFPSMIKYMDKKVGQILDFLKSKGLDKNTIVIFSGDNGTPAQVSNYDNDEEGEKGSNTEGGTHVPLIVYWPEHVEAGSKNDDLIDFTDFFSTFAEAGGITSLGKYGVTDGVSFYKRMLGKTDTLKSQLFIHYEPHPGLHHNRLERCVRDKFYKLYGATGASKSGNFYNILLDPNEKTPITDDKLTSAELAIKQKFQLILDTTGTWPKGPEIINPEATDISYNTVKLSATIKSTGVTKLIERGSTLSIDQQPSLIYGRKIDDTVNLGTFTIQRTNLKPQSKYKYTLYAMNGNKANSTSYAESYFYTLSVPPSKQPAWFKAITINCKITIGWNAAKFPSHDANIAGYLLVYSTNTPLIIQKPNGHSPTEIVLNGTAINLKSTLPELPIDSAVINGLAPEKNIYKFLLIPYTWDGLNDSTYNYLAEQALTLNSKIQNINSGLNSSVINPLCFGNSNGTIIANMTNGILPVEYSLNQQPYSTNSVFNNLGAGKYKLLAKDATGCIDSINVIMQQPSQLTLNKKAANISCDGGNDGSISLKADGGTPPYFYSITKTNFDTISYFKYLKANTYTAIAKDFFNCSDTIKVVLTQSSGPCVVHKFTIQPNPSNTNFALYLSNEDANNLSSINVYSTYGRLIEQIKGINNSVYFFGNRYVPGAYMVHVIFKNSIQNFKIVKL